ncbi:MAG: DUF4870 domain-containing protein [Pyrinomonadaceae bacterium]
MAKKKFDTNPLDPTFPERVQREAETVPLPKNKFKTAEFAPPSVTEEQTRRFDEANFDNYNAPYNGQNTPANFKTTNLADMNRASSRNVPGVGIPEKWLCGLPYIPWYIGLIASLIILFVVPKSETKVRFHAAQGLAAHLAILIVSAILGGLGHVTDFASVGNAIFQVVTMIMLIVFAIKAWQGKPVHIESVDDLTEWLEDKIKPQR